MGSTIIQAKTPQTDMLRANLAIRGLLSVAGAGRRATANVFRLPGMGVIDSFYSRPRTWIAGPFPAFTDTRWKIPAPEPCGNLLRI